MTEPAPPTLDTFYDAIDGSPIIGIPDVGGSTQLPQAKLAVHPFMWALDVFVFAGSEAHEATKRYAQGQAVSQMDIHAYHIQSTSSNVMQLMRVL